MNKLIVKEFLPNNLSEAEQTVLVIAIKKFGLGTVELDDNHTIASMFPDKAQQEAYKSGQIKFSGYWKRAKKPSA